MIVQKLIFIVPIIFLSGCSANSSRSLSSSHKTTPNFKSVSNPEPKHKYKAWNKTNWLMSEQEVKDAYPGKIVSAKQAEKWSDTNIYGTRGEAISSCSRARPEDRCTSLVMKDFEIFGENFNVFFYFTDNQLSTIKLIYDASLSSGNFSKAEECFNDANRLLTRKYGEPIESKKESKKLAFSTASESISKKKKWKAGHNNIVMTYYGCFMCRSNSNAATKIIYSADLQQVPIKSDFYEKNKDKI